MIARTKRALVSSGIAALMVAGMVTASPIAAQALPSNCNSYVATDGRGYAKCTGGTGYYKVGIGCKLIGPFGYGFTRQGNWAKVGGSYQSVAKCPVGTSNWSPNGGPFYAWIDQTAENI